MKTFPTTLEAAGKTYVCVAAPHQPGSSPGNAYIKIYREGAVAPGQYIGAYVYRVQQHNPHGYFGIPDHTEPESLFTTNGWNLPATDEWDAVTSAFTALVADDGADDSYKIPQSSVAACRSNAGGGFEEMAHAARQDYIVGMPSGSHLDYLGDDYDEL